MSKSKIVVLGARGMLGTDIVNLCQKKDIEVLGLDLPEFDITDSAQVTEAVKGSEIVINCAAYTNVEKAESEPEIAYKVNAEAVGRLGQIAKVAGARVLHISTDFVFDGRSERPYVETDPMNPISVYGGSKADGEKLLTEAGGQFCIVRVQWTYGAGGNNFVKKLTSLAKAGKPLRIVDDQIGSPTATTEAAGAICQLLDDMPQGVFHFAAAGYVSRYDMAKFMFDKLGMDVELSSCKSAEYAAAAARPLNSCFDCSKIASLLDKPIKPWQEPLEHFLEQI